MPSTPRLAAWCTGSTGTPQTLLIRYRLLNTSDTHDTQFPYSILQMAADVEQQKLKREKFSRRRRHNADNDIDYINERNMKFNQKCERFYGAYTQVTR